MDIVKVCRAMFDSAAPFYKSFINLAQWTAGILLAIAFIKTALDLAVDGKFTFHKVMIGFLVVGLIIVSYIPLTHSMVDFQLGVIGWGKVYQKQYYNMRLEVTDNNSRYMTGEGGVLGWLRDTAVGSWHTVRKFFSGNSIAVLVTHILNILASIIFFIQIASQFAAFIVVWMVGPFAVIFLLSDDLRNIGIAWITNVIYYHVLFVCINMGLAMSNGIQGFMIKETVVRHLRGDYGWEMVLPYVLNSLICISIAFLIPSSLRGVFHVLGGGDSGMAAAGIGAAFMTAAYRGAKATAARTGSFAKSIYNMNKRLRNKGNGGGGGGSGNTDGGGTNNVVPGGKT